MRTVRVQGAKRQLSPVPVLPIPVPLAEGSVTLAMIEALIPLGLRAVEEALQQEVRALAGVRYAHDDGHPGIARWGQQPGSIYLADQKLPITVPRVRDRAARREVPLTTFGGVESKATNFTLQCG